MNIAVLPSARKVSAVASAVPVSSPSSFIIASLPSATARFEVTDLGELNPDISNKGYRANISYIDQNADGTLGWAIGYARMQSPTAEERFNAWGYPEVTDGTDTAFILGGHKPHVKSNELKRDGVMAVLEWEPRDRLHTPLHGNR